MAETARAAATLPPAVILNVYATGLGIARNLTPHGVPVYGLSVQANAPGNFSKQCRALKCPDSQDEPEALLAFLLEMAVRLGARAMLLPTRDQDIRFLDRHRSALDPYYDIPQPSGDRLDVIMNKHRLAEEARAAGIPTPLTVRVRSREDALDAASRFAYPVVAKAVYAQDWRAPGIADAVHRRKAVKIASAEESRGSTSGSSRIIRTSSSRNGSTDRTISASCSAHIAGGAAACSAGSRRGRCSSILRSSGSAAS